MKTVTICIPSFQCGDTIALCIESIRRFTSYPHNIIVYDDMTDSALYDDLTYLRAARDKGWLKLTEGRVHINHGHAIALMLDTVTTDLAMVMDCDIQVLRHGWLDKMVAHQEATGAALISDIEPIPNIASWFFMLDMAQYPAVKTEWDYTPIDPRDLSKGMHMTGYEIWRRVVDTGRVHATFPPGISSFPSGPDAYYNHHTHISCLSWPQEGPNWETRRARYAVIQSELRKLRAGA